MGYFLGDASIWIMDQPNVEREGGTERERESNPLLRQGHLTFLVREWKRNKSPWTDEDEDEDESPREIAREAADREIAPSRLPTRP